MRTLASLTVAAVFVCAAADSPAQSKKKNKTGAESFRARATVAAASASGGALLTINIDEYTPDRDIQAMEQALKSGGSAGFLEALRRAPAAGKLQIGNDTFTIRWARQKPTASGRVISIVTDAPVYFVGAGVPGAKPKTGYDLAVLQLKMDSTGVGEGTMAAAARVKPGGPTGVEIDDYAAEPVKLVSVFRVIS